MRKILGPILCLILAACADNQVKETQDSVILYRNGEFKKSPVKMFGVYCTVAWYKTLDDIYIKSDGTTKDGPFEYKWTLNEFEQDADKIWFDKTCKEIK